MPATYMSSLVAQLLRLLPPPLEWKCRTLSLTSTFFIWVHITMSVDSVEKSISSHCYSNLHSLLPYTYIYNTDFMQLVQSFVKQILQTFLRSRKTVATQSTTNKDKTWQTTYDIILLCVLGSKCSVIYALFSNKQF